MAIWKQSRQLVLAYSPVSTTITCFILHSILFLCLDLENKLSYWQSIYNYMDLSPQADDALLTISASLARLASRKVENGDSSCSLKVLKVLEVTSYFHNDSYKVGHFSFLENVFTGAMSPSRYL